MAYPVSGAGGKHEEMRPFRQDIAARCPRHVWFAKVETRKKLLLYQQRLRPQSRKTANTAAKLADIESLCRLVETLPVAPPFGEPACGLEAKSDRQALLAMRSPS